MLLTRLQHILARAAAQPNGCLFFGNPKAKYRYATVKLNGSVINAHRAVFILANGPINSGFEVCHQCDNTRCINPDHLFLGTHAENMADKARKQRCNPPVGERRSKYKEVQMRQVLALAARGFTSRQIAQATGVAFKRVAKVRQGKAWKHLRAA